MKVINFKQGSFKKVEDPQAKDVNMQVLISAEDGAPNFAMRIFQVNPNGYTPYHAHNWEHEVFILKGEGTITVEKKESKFKYGDAIFVPPNVMHQFKNDAKEELLFLCLIPVENTCLLDKK
jgi:quercetin dioxygenase-like cupin family protein